MNYEWKWYVSFLSRWYDCLQTLISLCIWLPEMFEMMATVSFWISKWSQATTCYHEQGMNFCCLGHWDFGLVCYHSIIWPNLTDTYVLLYDSYVYLRIYVVYMHANTHTYRERECVSCMILTKTSEMGSSDLVVLSSFIDKDTEAQRGKYFVLSTQN